MDIHYELQTTSDGQQSLVSVIPGLVTTEVIPDGQTVVSSTPIDVTAGRFDLLATMAVTHDIKVDTISGRATLMPKITDTPAQKPNQANA